MKETILVLGLPASKKTTLASWLVRDSFVDCHFDVDWMIDAFTPTWKVNLHGDQIDAPFKQKVYPAGIMCVNALRDVHSVAVSGNPGSFYGTFIDSFPDPKDVILLHYPKKEFRKRWCTDNKGNFEGSRWDKVAKWIYNGIDGAIEEILKLPYFKFDISQYLLPAEVHNAAKIILRQLRQQGGESNGM
jgi:hypothetical protein